MCCFLCLECSSQDWFGHFSDFCPQLKVFLCNPTTIGSPRNSVSQDRFLCMHDNWQFCIWGLSVAPSSGSCRRVRPVFHSTACLLAVTTQSVFLTTSHRSLEYNPHLLQASSSFKTSLSHYPLCDTSLSYAIRSWSVGLPSHHFTAPVPELVIAAIMVFYNC